MSLLTPSPELSLADTILLAIEEGVTIYDTDFRLIAWNEKYAVMGITPREHLQRGLHIEDTYRYAAELGVFGPGDPLEIAKHRAEQAYSGNSPSVEDLEGTDGEIVEIRRYFLKGIGIAAVFCNVTEARRLTRMAQRSESLEILARMTGGIAHDFKNILQVISTNLSVAQITGDQQPLRDATDAAQVGSGLAKHLMQIAQPNGLEDRSHFDAVVSAKSTMRWIEGALREHVSLQFKHRGGTITVWANEGRFSLALVNLVMNANDAINEGGQICVTLEPEPSDPAGMMRVTVEDNGHGMDESLVHRATHPYFTTKGDKGTGLGLYAVKSFVDSVGGDFRLSSSLAVGTVASMSLPLSVKNSETATDSNI